MEIKKILSAKKIIFTKIADQSGKTEMLKLAKKIKEHGFEYILIGNGCLFLEKKHNNYQEVIFLETMNGRLFVSKYRYNNEHKMIRIFENHKHKAVGGVRI